MIIQIYFVKYPSQGDTLIRNEFVVAPSNQILLSDNFEPGNNLNLRNTIVFVKILGLSVLGSLISSWGWWREVANRLEIDLHSR